MCVCHSPKLFAAYHVLLRLAVPRHPPCALSRLIVSPKLSFRSHVLGFLFDESVFLSRSSVVKEQKSLSAETAFSKSQVSGFRSQVSGFRFEVSGFSFEVPGSWPRKLVGVTGVEPVTFTLSV